MRISLKLGLTALMAALLLVSALSTASARNLEVSNLRFRVTWSRLEFQSSLATLRCQFTLEGSFHARTMPKVERTLIGHITRVDVKTESCSGGQFRIRRETLPWHVTYESFTGTLPNITAVRLLLRRFLIEQIVFGVTCSWGTAADNLSLSATLNAAREVTNLVPVTGRNTLHLLEGGEICSPEMTLVGSTTDGVFTVLNSTTRIRVTLI